MIFAIAIPTIVIGTIAVGSETDILPTEPIITYIEIWDSDRTDEEISERQRVMALQENERRALSRQRFQQLAEESGVEYDREAAAEADRITEENRQNLLLPGEEMDGIILETVTDSR